MQMRLLLCVGLLAACSGTAASLGVPEGAPDAAIDTTTDASFDGSPAPEDASTDLGRPADGGPDAADGYVDRSCLKTPQTTYPGSLKTGDCWFAEECSASICPHGGFKVRCSPAGPNMPRSPKLDGCVGMPIPVGDPKPYTEWCCPSGCIASGRACPTEASWNLVCSRTLDGSAEAPPAGCVGAGVGSGEPPYESAAGSPYTQRFCCP